MFADVCFTHTPLPLLAMAGKITLLRLQRAGTTTHYTQGVATLYPGLCAFALTARQLPT